MLAIVFDVFVMSIPHNHCNWLISLFAALKFGKLTSNRQISVTLLQRDICILHEDAHAQSAVLKMYFFTLKKTHIQSVKALKQHHIAKKRETHYIMVLLKQSGLKNSLAHSLSQILFSLSQMKWAKWESYISAEPASFCCSWRWTRSLALMKIPHFKDWEGLQAQSVLACPSTPYCSKQANCCTWNAARPHWRYCVCKKRKRKKEIRSVGIYMYSRGGGFTVCLEEKAAS